MTPDRIAEICHETNRAYCATLGDTSQPPWAEAPDWQKASAVNGVRLHLHYPDTTPEASHICWLQEKTDNGWTWGPVKDPVKKEHPCCVPYNELPEDQRIKDYLFKGIVVALRPFLHPQP